MTKSSQIAAERKTKLSGISTMGERSVSGVVHVIRNEAEVDKFREGEILVAQMTDPSWQALFSMAKGIVTENGDLVSHAAVVAREYDLPAIVGVKDAMEQLRSGDIVTLHSDGSIERLEERREPDSPMRVSVPAAVAARTLSGNIITDPRVIAMPDIKPAVGSDDNDEHKKAG